MDGRKVCAKDCPRRHAECRRSCPEWAAYEAGKREEYQHNTERAKGERTRSGLTKAMQKKARRQWT